MGYQPTSLRAPAQRPKFLAHIGWEYTARRSCSRREIARADRIQASAAKQAPRSARRLKILAQMLDGHSSLERKFSGGLLGDIRRFYF
jgi:hypothetical protein